VRPTKDKRETVGAFCEEKKQSEGENSNVTKVATQGSGGMKKSRQVKERGITLGKITFSLWGRKREKTQVKKETQAGTKEKDSALVGEGERN